MKNRSGKTTFFIGLLVGILIVFIGIAVFFGINLLSTFNNEIDTDVQNYISGNCWSFNGGEIAKDFLPSYNQLSDYENIEFQYFDGTKNPSFFHKYYISYVLDIKYNTDMYETEKSKMSDEWVEDTEMGDYSFFTKNEIDSSSIKCLCYNDKENIIRYMIFIDPSFEGDANISRLIPWDTAVDWM